MQPPLARMLDRGASLLLAWLPATGIAALGLLLADAYTAQRAFLLGTLAAALLVRPLWNAEDPVRWPARGPLALVVILLLAAIIRWPGALHVQGGQDQGVYVAMAAHYDRHGHIDIEDPVRAALTSPEAKSRFDAGNAGGVYEPGIYIDVDRPGHYFPRFYHLQSLWLAMAGALLGMADAAAAQVFFGIVAILFLSLVAVRLARDPVFGIAYAAVLAILPLHVFFSKFPISEMPTLAFAAMAGYAMLRHHERPEDPAAPRWLLCAALAFLCVFLMRISGFLYLPLLLLGATASHIGVDDERLRRRWLLFWFGTLLLYAGTVVYGSIWAAPYSHEIYSTGLGPTLYASIRWWLPAALALIVLSFLATRSAAARRSLRPWLGRAVALGARAAPLVVAGGALYASLRISQLAFTDRFHGHAFYDLKWHVSHGGIEVLRLGVVPVFVEHATPLVAAALLLALVNAGREPPRLLLVALVTIACAYSSVVQWFVPYQYYYARYLLSETVPFAMLLVFVRAGDWWQQPRLRRWLATAAVATLAWCAWFTWPLIGFREAQGAEASLARIARHLDRDDVLIVDTRGIPVPGMITTPLRLWFDKRVYILDEPGHLRDVVRDLKAANASDLYLVSGQDVAADGFALVEHVTYDQRVMAPAPYIPRTTNEHAARLSLYALDERAWLSSALRSADGVKLSDLPADCCSGIHADHLWTDAEARIRLPGASTAARLLVIGMHGLRDYGDADVRVYIDGHPLPQTSATAKELRFDAGGIDTRGDIDLRITSRSFVPRELGLNDDERRLGVDIESLRFE